MKKKIGILMIILIIIICWGLYQYSHTSSPREIEDVYMTGGTTPQFYDNLMFFWDFKRYEDNNELILEVVDIVKENSQSIVLSSIHWEDDGHWPTPYITVREDNSYAIGVVDRVIYYNPQTGDIQNKQLSLGNVTVKYIDGHTEEIYYTKDHKLYRLNDINESEEIYYYEIGDNYIEVLPSPDSEHIAVFIGDMQSSEIFILDRDGNKLFEDDQYFQEMYWISDDKLFFGQDIYIGTKGYVLDIQDFQYISELTEPVSIKMDSNGILYTYNYKEDTLRIYTDIIALQYKEYKLSERRMSDLEIYLYKDIIYEPRTDREGRFFLYKIPCSEIDN